MKAISTLTKSPEKVTGKHRELIRTSISESATDLSNQMASLVMGGVTKLERLDQYWRRVHQEKDRRIDNARSRFENHQAEAKETCVDSLPMVETQLLRLLTDNLTAELRDKKKQRVLKWIEKIVKDHESVTFNDDLPSDQPGFRRLAFNQRTKRDKAQNLLYGYKPPPHRLFFISSLVFGPAVAILVWWDYSLLGGIILGGLVSSGFIGARFYFSKKKPKILFIEYLKDGRKLELIRKHWLDLVAKKYADAKNIARGWLNDKKNEIRTQQEFNVSDIRTSFKNFEKSSGLIAFDWSKSSWWSFTPKDSSTRLLRIGRVELDLKFTGIPFIKKTPAPLSLPALVSLSNSSGILLKVSKGLRPKAILAIKSLMLRLLVSNPAGMTRFVLIDPVDRGQNVAAFLHLNDYEPSLTTEQAWTEPRQIEQRLFELTDHLNTMIQKHLLNDYASIDEYNVDAGPIAQPYRVLVILDFPTNFSKAAVRYLKSIVQHGARCGIYTLMVMDPKDDLPRGFYLAEFEKSVTAISLKNDKTAWPLGELPGCNFKIDRSPPKSLGMNLINIMGKASQTALEVKVSYPDVLNLAGIDDFWMASAIECLTVPLGLAGAKKILYLVLGKGTAHHGLFSGQTGSGKSTLLHVIISTIALIYPPEEAKLYLIDFKKGVEFKPYADNALPHARVIAIESEREFGLSVLQSLNDELKRRGELFRELGVGNYPEFRKKGSEIIPRLILIVDEFQEFFVLDDQVSRQAGLILDRLGRQGRAFGIHVILVTQTLGGYSLPRSTMDQMAVRIATKCSEADSRLILADDNPAARLLSRPGEAIYNSSGGLVEGNNFFQVAMFTEKDRRACFREIKKQMIKSGRPRTSPVVFEGHQPSRLEACLPLIQALNRTDAKKVSRTIEAWLGEPIAIAPPVSIRINPQSGRHLLVVTKEEEQGMGMMVSCLLGLAAQLSHRNSRFFIVNLASADAEVADIPEAISGCLPTWVEVFGSRNFVGLFEKLNRQLILRVEKDSGAESRIFLLLFGLHRARKLRSEEVLSTFSFGLKAEKNSPCPAEIFSTFLRDGPEVGLHVIAWVDNYANLMRTVDRRLLMEFGLRVLGPMSADASIHMIDDPAAARLDHRRMLFSDDDRPGVITKLRPYALPSRDWIVKTAEFIQKRSYRSIKEV